VKARKPPGLPVDTAGVQPNELTAIIPRKGLGRDVSCRHLPVLNRQRRQYPGWSLMRRRDISGRNTRARAPGEIAVQVGRAVLDRDRPIAPVDQPTVAGHHHHRDDQILCAHQPRRAARSRRQHDQAARAGDPVFLENLPAAGNRVAVAGPQFLCLGNCARASAFNRAIASPRARSRRKYLTKRAPLVGTSGTHGIDSSSTTVAASRGMRMGFFRLAFTPVRRT
jgi:hypothetical protein